MDAQELARRLQQARDEGKQAARTEFAAQQQAAEARLADLERANRQQRLTGLLADLKRQGKVLPAWEKAGMAHFMESLEQATWPQTITLTFSEGGPTLTPATWFQQFLVALPQMVQFAEVARQEGDVGAEDPGERLVELAYHYLDAHRDGTYAEAFAAVQQAHPELAQAYLMAQRG